MGNRVIVLMSKNPFQGINRTQWMIQSPRDMYTKTHAVRQIVAGQLVGSVERLTRN